jgi:hypothetical protein
MFGPAASGEALGRTPTKTAKAAETDADLLGTPGAQPGAHAPALATAPSPAGEGAGVLVRTRSPNVRTAKKLAKRADEVYISEHFVWQYISAYPMPL